MKNPIPGLIIFILLVNTCLCTKANGQKEFGFKMPDKVNSITIPFEQQNNLILIPLTLNKIITLKFILDTGVETAILTEKIYGDILKLNYIRDIIVEGPGIEDSVEAYVTNEVMISLPGGIIGQNMNMMVLKDDYLKLSENIGQDVHGIIGYDIFSRFVVTIDYDNKLITLTRPEKFKADKQLTALDLEIIGSKPFINAIVKQQHQTASLDVMVDTGASHAALLDYSLIDGLSLPKNKIITHLGRGIAGEIPGYVGRMDSVWIKSFSFGNMLVSAPFDGIYNKVIKRGARIGTVGGDLLARFQVTLDYNNKKMYVKKGRDYKDKFEYDMSGLSLNASGNNLDILKVVNVDETSPAFTAGIEIGDIIKSINGRNLTTCSLSRINHLLRSKDGKKIKIKIIRDGDILKKQFVLKRVI